MNAEMAGDRLSKLWPKARSGSDDSELERAPIPMQSETVDANSLISRPRPVLSLCLGMLSLLLGPFTGIPAIVLGFRGLRQLRNQPPKSGVRRRLCAGIVTGLFGTLLTSGAFYLTVMEIYWPAVGRRVDRIFRDIEQERFAERYDGLWPAVRDVAPDSLYRAANERWPPMDSAYRFALSSIWAYPGRSGILIGLSDLRSASKPIIALGKPAVPQILKWVTHREWYVRFVATYALEEISQLRIRALFLDPIDPEAQREAIRIWQKWYDEQP